MTRDKNNLQSPSVLTLARYMCKIFQFPVIQTIFFFTEEFYSLVFCNISKTIFEKSALKLAARFSNI